MAVTVTLRLKENYKWAKAKSSCKQFKTQSFFLGAFSSGTNSSEEGSGCGTFG